MSVEPNENEFEEKLHQYYQLKSVYDKSFSSKKMDIKKLRISLKEKRELFRKFVPRCVSCSRVVGSKFEKKKVADGNTHLFAECGDKVNPCKLDIDLDIGNTVINIIKDKRDAEDTIDTLARQIIAGKNNEIFGYVSEADTIALFANINKELAETMDYYRDVLDSYIKITNNKEKMRKIADMTDLLNTHVRTIRTYVDEFEKTNNKQFIKDAVQLYVNEMRTNLDAMYAKKYAYNAVEYIENDMEYNLVQNETILENFLLPASFEVIRFVMGKQPKEKGVKSNAAASGTGNTGSAASGQWGVAVPDVAEMSARNATDANVEEDIVGTGMNSSIYTPHTPDMTPPDMNSSIYTPHTPDMTPPDMNSSSSSYHPDMDSDIEYASGDDDDDDDDDADADADADDDDRQPITIGDEVGTSSGDEFVPPPPPPLDEMDESSSDGYVPPPPAHAVDTSDDTTNDATVDT